MSAKLDLSDNMKASLLALHHAGGTLTYRQVLDMGQAASLGAWALTHRKLATWMMPDQAFELTDKGTLIARMLER